MELASEWDTSIETVNDDIMLHKFDSRIAQQEQYNKNLHISENMGCHQTFESDDKLASNRLSRPMSTNRAFHRPRLSTTPTNAMCMCCFRRIPCMIHCYCACSISKQVGVV